MNSIHFVKSYLKEVRLLARRRRRRRGDDGGEKRSARETARGKSGSRLGCEQSGGCFLAAVADGEIGDSLFGHGLLHRSPWVELDRRWNLVIGCTR